VVRFVWLSTALALVGGLAVPVSGRAEDAFRPCRRGDLVGSWGVIRFGFASGASVDRGDPAYQPYQHYVFNADATMTYAAAAAPPTPEQQQALLRGPASATWRVDDRGRLMRQAAGSARVETSECRVITRTVRDPRSSVPALPGDVLLTDQREDESPIARRLLRKLPPDP
jgi:hypothetical protein